MKRNNKTILFLLFILLSFFNSKASIVFLQNGNILSGKIKYPKKDSIVLESRYGTFKIARTKIKRIIIDEKKIKKTKFLYKGKIVQGRLIEKKNKKNSFILDDGKIVTGFNQKIITHKTLPIKKSNMYFWGLGFWKARNNLPEYKLNDSIEKYSDLDLSNQRAWNESSLFINYGLMPLSFFNYSWSMFLGRAIDYMNEQAAHSSLKATIQNIFLGSGMNLYIKLIGEDGQASSFFKNYIGFGGGIIFVYHSLRVSEIVIQKKRTIKNRLRVGTSISPYIELNMRNHFYFTKFLFLSVSVKYQFAFFKENYNSSESSPIVVKINGKEYHRGINIGIAVHFLSD